MVMDGDYEERQSRSERFLAVATNIILDKFRTICRNDEDILRKVMEQFAKTQFPEGEYAEIEGLSDEKLCELITIVSFNHPEVLVAYLELAKEAVDEVFSQEEGEQKPS